MPTRCLSNSPQTRHTTLSSTPYRQLENQAPNTTGSDHLYNTLELLMMGIMVPETCWASNNICNKNHLWHLVGILFPHINDDERSKPHQFIIIIIIVIRRLKDSQGIIFSSLLSLPSFTIQILQHNIRTSTAATSYCKTEYRFYWGAAGSTWLAVVLQPNWTVWRHHTLTVWLPALLDVIIRGSSFFGFGTQLLHTLTSTEVSLSQNGCGDLDKKREISQGPFSSISILYGRTLRVYCCSYFRCRTAG